MYPKTYQAYSVIPWSTELIQVVEKFVLPQERKSKNCDGKTPLQIFIEEHKELMAYDGQWMMGMATSCTVAASLIATVVFAAAITVPGGSTVDGFPIFSKKKAFIVFAISDGLALVSALSTVLSFLSIFTSRYAVIDYLYALPMRLIIGLLALFLSVITMMTAFSATLYLVFSKENALILIPVPTLACLPVALFATLQLPPLLNMIKSTYGPSIFSQ
ncbi:Ankyrin repeat-containing protein ITN1 [Camellia lanceoleosa]|uniref:Ankyrin repeat-containing protein ITN1 n=1 Tax=Camellia lanceoleosa TaxID=1840588 RepID=A0ACC0FM34_9ERIC|nr:Ankyrin repeat-containing protein ITN1 [Camellia lanceoleosa]